MTRPAATGLPTLPCVRRPSRTTTTRSRWCSRARSCWPAWRSPRASKALARIAPALRRHVSAAAKAIEAVPDPALRPTAIAELGVAAAQAGHPEVVAELVATAVATAGEIVDPVTRTSALWSLSPALRPDIQGGGELVGATAEQLVGLTDPGARATARAWLVPAAAACGNDAATLFAAARADAGQLAEPGMAVGGPAVLETLAIAAAACRWPGPVAELAARCADPAAWSRGHTTLAAAAVNAGDTALAVRATDALRDPTERINAYLWLTDLPAALGELGADLYDAARRAAATLTDAGQRAWALGTIAQKATGVGLIAPAQAAIDNLGARCNVQACSQQRRRRQPPARSRPVSSPKRSTGLGRSATSTRSASPTGRSPTRRWPRATSMGSGARWQTSATRTSMPLASPKWPGRPLSQKRHRRPGTTSRSRSRLRVRYPTRGSGRTFSPRWQRPRSRASSPISPSSSSRSPMTTSARPIGSCSPGRSPRSRRRAASGPGGPRGCSSRRAGSRWSMNSPSAWRRCMSSASTPPDSRVGRRTLLRSRRVRRPRRRRWSAHRPSVDWLRRRLAPESRRRR